MADILISKFHHANFSYLKILIFLSIGSFSMPLMAQFLPGFQSGIAETKNLAKEGQISSQFALALAYEHGEGLEKNQKQAIYWYCKAAVKGDSNAQVNLAWMLLNARGIEEDEALAVRWFKAAANSGDQYAQQMLSQLDTNLSSTKYICDKPLITPYWQTKKCSKNCRNIVKIVNTIAPLYNIEARLILAVIQQESNFNSKALSPKGAMGLMQLMPATAKRFAVSDAWDAQQNIIGGTRYLAWLLKKHQGNVTLVLASYNAGEQSVKRYKGIPPYKETQNYVKRIIKVYGSTQHSYNKT